MEMIHDELEQVRKLQKALQLALDSLARIESLGTINNNLDIPPDGQKFLSPEALDAKQTRDFILRGEF